MNTVYRWGLAGILCSVMIGFAAPIFAEEAVPPALTPEDEAKIGAFFEKEEGAGRMYKFFKSVEISGFVDTYYEYNFSNPTSNLG